jgi:hypothetical protein
MAVVNIQRLADGSLVLAPAERAIALPPGWTIEDHPLDWLAGSAAGPEQVQGYLQLVSPAGAPPPAVLSPATFTDAAPHTLATIAVPAGGMVLITLSVLGNLGTSNGVGGTNAPNSTGVWIVSALAWRVGSGSVGVALLSALANASSPFLPLANASSTGLVAVVAGATSAAIQVNGFAPTDAWTSGNTYTRGDGSTIVGQFVTANGNVYMCSSDGTASGSAPSGTGTGLGTGAKFDYVCAGSVIPVQWSGQYTTAAG